jgi:hypothetical protein
MRIVNNDTGEIVLFSEVFPDETFAVDKLEAWGYHLYVLPEVIPEKAVDPYDQLMNDIEAYYNTIAKIKQYDSWMTCALRAGYEGPFQQEGITFATWMDECNVIVYPLVDSMKAGTAPVKNVAEFISLLPTAPW